MTATSPVLPAIPRGVPAWLIRAVSLLIAACGPLLDVWNPGGKLNTPAVQATIIVAFLVVGAIIFTVHVVFAAVHEYGWSKRAASDIATQELDELRQLWPDMKASYEQAQPVLAQLPGFTDLAARVATVEKTVSASSNTAALANEVKALILHDVVAAQTVGVQPVPVEAPVAPPAV